MRNNSWTGIVGASYGDGTTAPPTSSDAARTRRTKDTIP